MLKRAAYCFDDELVAGMSEAEPVKRKALCLKCKKEHTPHRTGICISCRTVNCASCGKPVKQQFKRKLCTKCSEIDQRARAYAGLTEDELNGT